MRRRAAVGGRAFAAGLLLAASSAFAGSSIMIWPLSLSIEPPARATALWLENGGSRPVNLQVRVLAWEQVDGQDRYRAQGELVGTPPFARVEPGRRQLIRLTLTQAVPSGRELAYRVLVDEIPQAGIEQATLAPAATASAALKFVMRYSLPLFFYPSGAVPAPTDAGTAPEGLSWRAERVDDHWLLYVRNDSPVHARLSQVRLEGKARAPMMLADGLLGYVLPGGEMRWPLAAGVTPSQQDDLRVRLGSRTEPVLIPRRP